MSIAVSRLLHEAASASSVLWLETDGGATYPLWFVWHDDGDPMGIGPAAYVVGGQGEQNLPALGAQVVLIFRSKDSGGRLLRISADVVLVTPQDPDWARAVAVVQPARLNSVGDSATAWLEGVTIAILTPHGRPSQGPGTYDATPQVVKITPAVGTTRGRAPWHLGGRARRRARD